MKRRNRLCRAQNFHRAILRLTSLKRIQDDWKYAEDDSQVTRLTRTCVGEVI